MKHIFSVLAACIVFLAVCVQAQDFNPNPVSFTPQNQIEFKMNLPIVHLDVNNYVPSIRGLYAGQDVAFKFYCRNAPWTNTALFMRVRWDSDLDASNGITWSDWFQNENEGAFMTVMKNYPVPGNYTIAFEIEFFVANGSQAYSRQKQYDITVAPMPTAVYQDSRNNRLFYWVGNDGVYNKPAFLVEGFDPDNSNTPEVNYGLGFDLIQLAQGQGYDVFIAEWADGGGDLVTNKDVFLGACQFMHNKLNGVEGAVQVVGISMGGTVARYGLAFAEDDIRAHIGQYVEHYVNTFISFDSPQQGAHLNTDLQKFIRDNGNTQQQTVLLSTAAKQMLYQDVYENKHDAFYSSLKDLHNSDPTFNYTNGYPRRCKNFSVSNGNRKPDYPNRTTNDPLATLKIYTNINIENIITLPVAQKTVPIYAQQRDLWPGSTFPHDLTKLYSAGYKFIPSLGLALLLTQAFAAWRFEVNFNPGYTPTESALDLDGYTRSADGSLIGGTSWFDDTLTQITFHRHEELTTESKDKVMSWLNSNRTHPYLGRPSNLAAAPASYQQIKLTFTDEAAFEDGFKIERKTSNGTYVEIATIGPNINQFIDYCVNPTTAYTYRVRSYSGNTYSAYSAEISATTPAIGNIQAPENFVVAGQPNYISLAWNSVPGITGYRIYRGNAGQSCPNLSLDVSTNSYLDILPGSQQQYSYRVTGINGVNEGLASHSENATPLHLASQSSSALGVNNQHKIVESITGGFPTLNQTFESGGASFFSWSNNGGDTWSDEIPVGGYPSASRSYKNPTLVLDSTGKTVHILYDLVAADAGTHKLLLGGYSLGSNTITTIAGLDNTYASSAFDLLPSAAWTKPATNRPSLLAYVYRINTTFGVFKGFGLGTFYQPSPLWPAFTFSNFDLTTALRDFPVVSPSSIAVAANLRNEGTMKYAFYVVWAEDGENGGVKFARGLYTWQFPLFAGNIVWDNSKAFTIAQNTSYESNTNPTLAIDGSGNVFIAWEYRKTSSPQQGNIKVQKRDGGYAGLAPLNTYTFPNNPGSENYPYLPSLVDYRNSVSKANDLTLTWDIMSSQFSGTYCAYYIGSVQAWSASMLVDPDGRQANAQLTAATRGITPRAIYVNSSGPPYTIQKIDLPFSLPPAPPILSCVNVSIGNVAHPKLQWTRPSPNIQSYQLYKYYCLYGREDCNEGGVLLATLTDTTYTDLSVNVGGKNVLSAAYYYVTATYNNSVSSEPSNKISVNTSNIAWKTVKGNVEEEQLPAETKLLVNYPNPFNPQTMLKYQIAQPGRVQLIVYNLLGQEVERIVDAEVEAGNYTASWSTGTASGGVYYARMVVTDPLGKQLYHETKKLLLMK